MTTPPDACLFCKIVAGTVPAEEVRSTELSFAFRDINPGAPTHVLVIPRTHIENAHELAAEHGPVLMDMVALAQGIADDEGVSGGGYRLVFNVGDDSGNSVPHLHLHVLGGRKMGWPPG